MLQAEHLPQATTVVRAIGYALGEHQHPFDACALVTAGDLTLVVDGVARNYAVGQIFRLPAGVVHLEYAGPQGATLNVSRRMVEQGTAAPGAAAA